MIQYGEDVSRIDRVRRLLTILAGLLFLGICSWGLLGIYRDPSSLGMNFGRAVFSMAIGVAGSIMIAPSITMWVIRPFVSLVDSIYLPREYAKKPPLRYELADQYFQNRKLDKAIVEYYEILRHYPREPKAMARLFTLLHASGLIAEARKTRRRANLRLSHAERSQFEEQIKTDLPFLNQ